VWESKGPKIASGNLHGSLGSQEWGQEFVRGQRVSELQLGVCVGI